MSSNLLSSTCCKEVTLIANESCGWSSTLEAEIYV